MRIKYINGFGITDCGDIIGKRGRKLKFGINQKGYYQVRVTHERKKSWFIVHRTVAKFFIPNPNNLPQVNHKDGNKLNNHYSNLEWCNNSHNQLHA